MKTGVALIFAGVLIAFGFGIIGYYICQILIFIGLYDFLAFMAQVAISMIGVVLMALLWNEAFQVME